MILTYFSLLIPAFSLVCNPRPLPLTLHLAYDAPLPRNPLNKILCTFSLGTIYPLHRNLPSSTENFVQWIAAQASVYTLAPLNFRRRTTRPVSYYALFKCMAASKPTSWLFLQFHILSHLNVFRDLSCGSGLFPF